MRKTKKKKNKNHLRKARIKYYSIKKGGLLGDKGDNHEGHKYPKKRQKNEADIAQRSFKSNIPIYGNAAEAKAAVVRAATRAASNARVAERSAAWVDAWDKSVAAEEAAKALPKAPSKVTHTFPTYSDEYLEIYDPRYGDTLHVPMTYYEWRTHSKRKSRVR